jgi:hypothetical protein
LIKIQGNASVLPVGKIKVHRTVESDILSARSATFLEIDMEHTRAINAFEKGSPSGMVVDVKGSKSLLKSLSLQITI